MQQEGEEDLSGDGTEAPQIESASGAEHESPSTGNQGSADDSSTTNNPVSESVDIRSIEGYDAKTNIPTNEESIILDAPKENITQLSQEIPKEDDKGKEKT